MSTLNYSPIAYGPLLSTLVSQVIGSNPSRQGLMIVNPAAVAIAICPGVLSSTGIVISPGNNPAIVPVTPSIGGAGSITLQPGGLVILDTIFASGAFLGVAASGSGVPLTIWEALGLSAAGGGVNI